MKVLGIVASPRKLGNSEILVKEMLSALPEDCEKEMLRLTDLEIGQCKACYACLPEGSTCVIKDDFSYLLDKLKAADAVIIASACYFLGPHTSIKLVGDRLISVLQEGDALAGKKCVTAVVYGIPGWEGYAREAVLNFARFLHLEVVGDMLVQAANPGEAIRPDVLATARELAARLMGQAAPELAVNGAITCGSCGSSLLQLAQSGDVRCVMCGATGRLRRAGEQFEVEYKPQEHRRYSRQGMAEHGQLLEQIKGRYIASRGELFRQRKPYGDYDWWAKR